MLSLVLRYTNLPLIDLLSYCSGPMADAVDMIADAPTFGSSSLVAERVTREGLYREYDVDVGDQVFDDARSTYKDAKETKSKKGRCMLLYDCVATVL